MRGTLKTSTLESKFPLLRVENNCIISKFADITAAYRVTLPELFTLTASRKRVTASVSRISRGTMKPRHKTDEALVCRIRSGVVFVTNR